MSHHIGLREETDHGLDLLLRHHRPEVGQGLGGGGLGRDEAGGVLAQVADVRGVDVVVLRSGELDPKTTILLLTFFIMVDPSHVSSP